MKRHILSLRLNRRAIGAAVLADESLTLADGRHLTSNRDRAVVAAIRYVNQLLQQSSAGAVVVDAPHTTEGTTTSHVLREILALLSMRGFVPLLAGKADILSAYGLTPVRTRREVREIAASFWPDLTRISGPVKPYATDAAAAALFAECRLAINPEPT
jgi:hypothetical protein